MSLDSRATGVSTSARIRLFAWSAFLGVATLYALLLVSPLRGLARLILLEIAYLIPVAGTVILGAVAGTRAGGVERRFWYWLSAANAPLVVTELLLVWWIAFIDPMGPPRVSWPFHILHAIAAVCFLGLLVTMSRLRAPSLAARIRVTADFAIVVAIAYFAVIRAYTLPVMSVHDAPVAHVLVGAGYPLMGMLLLIGTLANVVGLRLVRWRSWERLTAGALGFYGMAISLWPLWYTGAEQTSRTEFRGWLDLAQMAGHYVLFMAVVYRLTDRTDWDLRPLPPIRWPGRWGVMFIPALAAVFIPTVAYAAYAARHTSGWVTVYAVIAGFLVVWTLVRSLTVGLEHDEAESRSMTDALTGLGNERFLRERLRVEVDQSVRFAEPLALLLIALDPPANGAGLGAALSEQQIGRVAARIAEECGRDRPLSRVGNEEFAVIVPGIDAWGASVFCRHVLDVISIEGGQQPGALTASAGIAAVPQHAGGAEHLLLCARAALRAARDAGPDGIVVFDSARVAPVLLDEL